jgi:hypothetical protein
MIELKYLCDYQIHVPIFNDDPTNKNICSHILKNYRNIIIYCNSQQEGKQINKLMNELQLNSSKYIDCNTLKKKRDIIIEKYKTGEIPFLVNVRILVEGFDAPITKGVCFLHLPTNKTTLIQIIGRCLRLHPTKIIANIILPFSSKKDEKNICNFLKVMAKNDSRIKKSFESKTLGGYISIENLEEIDDEENKDIEFKYNMIYDSMGLLINNEEIWMKKLDNVKLYIDENKKKPCYKNIDYNIKQLGMWISTQKYNYKNNIYIMTNQEIYNKWTEFINNDKYKIFLMNKKQLWEYKFELLIKYIDKNKKLPPLKEYIKRWFYHQKHNYKNKKQIMANEWIYNKWTEFINNDKYKIFLMNKEQLWEYKFNQVIEYININNKRPSSDSKNNDVKQLGSWISNQLNIYKNKEQIMENEEIYNLWTNFINNPKYKIYFMSNEEVWKCKFNQVIEYININNIKPSRSDNDKNIIQLNAWISTQLNIYKNKKQIMNNEEIYNQWTTFINDPKYKKYF